MSFADSLGPQAFLAAAVTSGTHTVTKGTLLKGIDILLIVGIAVLLLVGFMAWAIYLRTPSSGKRRRRRAEGRKVYVESGPAQAQEAAAAEEAAVRRRYKFRYRRRDHRRRNPTLAETGQDTGPKNPQGQV